MAYIGLRYPYYAKYHHDEATGAVSYLDGGLMGKAIEFSAKINTADNNILYADDGAAESDSSFGGGTMGITTDDLTQDATCALTGVKLTDFKVGEQTVKELVYDDNRDENYIGFGTVIPKMKNGITLFRAVVLTKVKFSIPEDSAKARGEKIEWQTPKVEGNILRDDTPRHAWKREITVDSEELARDYIKQILGISEKDATLSALSFGNLSLSPAFSKDTLNYEAATTNATNTVTATATDSAATVEITVNDTAVANGSAATWKSGENTVAVTVTNGASQKAYTVTVTKSTT